MSLGLYFVPHAPLAYGIMLPLLRCGSVVDPDHEVCKPIDVRYVERVFVGGLVVRDVHPVSVLAPVERPSCSTLPNHRAPSYSTHDRLKELLLSNSQITFAQ